MIPQIEINSNKVVVRFNLHATHQGNFMGIPATGREINVPGIIVYHLADGKITAHWMQIDSMAMMQQLGAKPVPTDFALFLLEGR